MNSCVIMTRFLMRKLSCLCCWILALSLPFVGQSVPSTSKEVREGVDRSWWKRAVFYNIYIRSFADTNNDGIGDITGITSKLDYLKKLGVDAIWITPCFPSPQADFGYDVSNYRNIEPSYGTLNDFDRLVREARKRGIRIVLDFVMNHTSDQHKWFQDSRSSRNSEHRDWYIWRDGKVEGPPNNWLSTFGGSAWKLDPATGQYYYHAFYWQQPDLNWRNPAVKAEMFDTARWWLKRGIAGFRLDAVGALFEDPALHDNLVLEGTNKFGEPKLKKLYDSAPESHALLRDLRKVTDEYGGILIGETWTKSIDELKAYYGLHDDELQMPMDFMFTMVEKLSAADFRKQIDLAESSGEWPVFVMNNMDIPRAYDRYGDAQHDDTIAKLLAGLYLTLRGTPILYYGEEIGMKTTDPERKEDVKDLLGKFRWPLDKGRDGERTPMQWSADVNGGFSQAIPWLPVPSTAVRHNVATESGDPDSILEFYRHLLALRRSRRALGVGEYVPLNESDPNVLAYLRRYKNEVVLVVLNFSSQPQTVAVDLNIQGAEPEKARVLLSTSGVAKVTLSALAMRPYGVFIADIPISGQRN